LLPDFSVVVGADAAPLEAEFAKIKKHVTQLRLSVNEEFKKINSEVKVSLNQQQFLTQLRDAKIAWVKAIQDYAGQLKFDEAGTELYYTLSSALDRFYSAQPNQLRIIPSRNQDTGRFQRAGTDVSLGDIEQQHAIVKSMEERARREDELQAAYVEGYRNYEQQQVDISRQKNLEIYHSMKARYEAEDELQAQLKAKEEAKNKIISDELNILPRLRYALYDVSAIAQQISQTLTAIPANAINVAASFESSFTAVERTTGATGEQLNNLRSGLLELSTEIPSTFQDITEVASLGAQLGIAAQDIVQFTETVTKFSAITNVSASSAAEAFGALGGLLDVTAANYDNMASAIAYAGTKSVATESEIISVSTAIAGVGANAGLNAQYVFGLSTALASLRVPSEQSRGALTRIFQEVNRAASSGGEAFQKFASIVGMSTDAAANLAKTDMGSFFTKFVEGLSGLDSQQLTTTLDAINLSDIRVTNTIARLSGNTDLLKQSLDNVNSAYATGSYQTEAFGKKVDDLESKLLILTNIFDEINASAGQGLFEFIKPALDLLTFLAKGIKDFSDTLGGKIFLGIAIGAAALGAAIAGVTAVIAAGFGGYLAFQTAVINAGEFSAIASGRVFKLAQMIARIPPEAIKANIALEGLAKSEATVGINADNAGKKITTLGIAMRAAGWIGLAVTAFSLIEGIWQSIAESQKSVSEQMAQTAQDYVGGGVDTIADALRKDMKSSSEAIQQISTTFEDSRTSLVGYAQDTANATGAQVAMTDALKNTVPILTAVSVAYKKNTQEAFATVLANSEKFQELFKNNTFGKIGYGANGKDFAQSILGDPVNGGKEYVNKLLETISNEAKADSGTVGLILENLFAAKDLGPLGYFGSVQAETAELAIVLGISYEKAMELANQLYILKGAADGTSAAITTASEKAAAAEAANNALGQSVEDVVAEYKAYADEINKSVDAQFSMIDGSAKVNKSLGALGEVFSSTGAEASLLGGQLKDVISALVNVDPTQAAGRLQFLLQYIQANVPNSAAVIEQLRIAIASIPGGSNAAPIAFDVSPLVSGMSKVKTSTAAAKQEIVTLSDYASDLSKVFSRAFEIKFDALSNLDKITKSFISISDATKEAAQSIQDINDSVNGLNADIATLSADRATQEYLLTLAQGYGDVARAGMAQAEIAKIDAQIASKKSDLIKKNSDLTKAQDKTNKTLVGNSEAAIDNRQTILELVGDYQKYITSLASSGMGQEELSAKAAMLRNDFITQATQLGYNSTELDTYATSFDDVATAIANVPRKITIDFNADAAKTALDEFLAKAKTVASGVSSAFDEAAGSILSGMEAIVNRQDKTVRGQRLMAEAERIRATGNGDPNGWAEVQYRQMLANYQLGNYASGGYTGPGGKYDVAGIVHKGEYVVPANQVNQMTGVPFFMQQQPQYFSGGQNSGSKSSPTTMIVELSPTDRQLLAQAGNVQLAIDGRVVAGATNRSNLVSAQRGTN
jgi:TP901 family phage tail tape measure protein